MRSRLTALLLMAAACGGGDHSTGPAPSLACGSGDTSTPMRVTLSVGESAALTDRAQSECFEIAADAGSRYVMAVVNTSTVGQATSSFVINGASRGAGSAVVTRNVAQGVASSAKLPFEALRRGEALHVQLLERDRAVARRFPNTLTRLRARAAARRASRSDVAMLPVPHVGDTTTMRIRDIVTDQDCTQFFTVGVRTVAVSQYATVLEDTASPYAGQVDAFFDSLAHEFDSVVLAELRKNFGDPLGMDSVLSSHGHVIMLFSPVLNVNFNNVAGFVSACDFFPYDTTSGPDQNLAGNEAPIFYGFVAIPTALDPNAFDRAQWEPFAHGLMAHETKHIASYVTHLLNNAAFEESWLEEATAQVSAELYARHIFGNTWKGNARFATTLACESPINSCGALAPQVMLQHFAGFLYPYLEDASTASDPAHRVSQVSPIAKSIEAYYGGSWSFVRWAVDQYAQTEDAFLKALINERSLTGIANLSARTGQPADQMLMDWSLALAIDDYPTGFQPARPALTLPSWNQRDVFSGIHERLRSFPREYPLVPTSQSYGAFSIAVNGLHGGGAATFELSGAAATDQLVELRTSDGEALPSGAALRVAIVRVQ